MTMNKVNNLEAVSVLQANFDTDLPNASAVLAALSCVSAQYAKSPSVDLAILASDLAYQLQAPEYAESKLITDVAEQLVWQWDAVVDQLNDDLLSSDIAHMACH